MNVTELQSGDDYRLYRKVLFKDLVPFILENLKPLNLVIGGFLFFTLFSGFLCGRAMLFIVTQGIDWSSFTFAMLGGLLFGPVILIIPHELLHGLAFKWIGAPKITFGADLKRYIFYAMAENFVFGTPGFYLVAFTPFVIISASLTYLTWISSPYVAWALSLTFLMHTFMCIGDFSMANFFYKNRDKKLLTFDEPQTITAFFYEKIQAGPGSV